MVNDPTMLQGHGEPGEVWGESGRRSALMSGTAAAPPILPAGLGLTHLRVYTSPAPDGQCGGSPHLHLACAELYYVLRGHGAVEFVSLAEGYRRVDLVPGGAVHFTPGVVHRLINGDGQLEILVVMQNSGLPERGDAVLTFPSEQLADPAAYPGAVAARDLEAAEQRRDLAVQGFYELLDGYRGSPEQGRQRLLALHRHALALVQPRVQEWAAVVEAGPAQAVRATTKQLAALSEGDAGYLAGGQVMELQPIDSQALRLGMCGRLWPYLAEGAVFEKTL